MSWYVISTPRHQESLVKQTLDKYFAPVYGVKIAPFKCYLPMRKETLTDFSTGKPKVLNVPVIAGLVFVHTDKSFLDQWLEQVGMGCQLYVDNANAPIVVPEYQIRLFKDYLSFVDSDVMVLRKPYSYFLKKKKIRILSGRFAGLEGRLYQIKGNYKLVYGLGNTALALSDIAKSPYVEITDEEPTEIRYAFYYDKLKEELNALLTDGVEDGEIVRCLNRWRQEASVLTQDSPVASSYVSLALQQSLADLYGKRHSLFEEKTTFRKVKSIYQDTADYLSLVSTQIENPLALKQISQRREKVESRKLYAADPLGLKQEEGPCTTNGFVREQEAQFVEIIRLLHEEEQPLVHRRQAHRKLVHLFQVIAKKLEQRGYRDNLDSTINYRLRKLLGMAARQYRQCKVGQDEDFVQKTQESLRQLLTHELYQPHGFFDLLGAIRRTPKV